MIPFFFILFSIFYYSHAISSIPSIIPLHIRHFEKHPSCYDVVEYELSRGKEMTEKREKKVSISWVVRTVLFLCAGAMLLLFLSEVFTGYGKNLGTIFGIFLSILVMAYMHFFDRVNKRIRDSRKNSKAAKRVQNCVLVAAALGVIYVITATSFMIAYAHRKAPASDRPPVLVVLGCLVVDDQPSTVLSDRIRTAYEYLVEHPDSPCIVSGGMGDDELISEAECMYRELVRMGISPDRIYKEDRSTSTRENLLFSKEIMEKENLGDTIVIVTNSWHELRASMIASSLDIPCGNEGAPTAPWRLPSHYLRELFGIAYQLVF